MQALGKMQFTPPPLFVMASANYLLMRLEAFMAAPHVKPANIDVSIITSMMTSLIAFSFDPPAPLLALVRPLLSPCVSW